MSIIGVILLFVIVGFVLWLVNQYVPMPPMIKTALNVIVVILLILYLVSLFGVLGPLTRPIR